MPPYKDLSLPQLRSFCETARLGSLSAAAAALGLAQPTVWKLVHALEKQFGRPLFETDPRGCRPTDAGRLLYTLAAACLANVDALPDRIRELLDAAEVKVTIASTPRLFAEDLVPCVAEFVRRRPNARFVFREMETNEVTRAVDDGQAQLGFTPAVGDQEKYPRVACEPWYALDVLLVLRTDHPLARRKRVRVKDLTAHPILFPRTNLNDFPNPAPLAALRLDEQSPQWVDARQASILRRCVLHGLGSLLLLGRPGEWAHPELTERVMSPELGKSTIYLVRQAGVDHHPIVAEFAELVRNKLSATDRKRSRPAAPRPGQKG
jgi:DNA-binding transcriptional LysR family regulator